MEYVPSQQPVTTNPNRNSQACCGLTAPQKKSDLALDVLNILIIIHSSTQILSSMPKAATSRTTDGLTTTRRVRDGLGSRATVCWSHVIILIISVSIIAFEKHICSLTKIKVIHMVKELRCWRRLLTESLGQQGDPTSPS